MHATFEQLLSLREAGGDETVASGHVRGCNECRVSLERLQGITAQLRGLPLEQTPPDSWAAIRTRLLARAEEQGRRKSPIRTWLLPAAGAAAVVVVAILTWMQDRPATGEPAQLAASTSPMELAPAQDPRRALIAQSQRLEALLGELPAEQRLTRVATALTVADLEDRIQWVDYRLALADEAGLKPYQSQLLWRERVDLLNSLVAVRIAETSAVAY